VEEKGEQGCAIEVGVLTDVAEDVVERADLDGVVGGDGDVVLGGLVGGEADVAPGLSVDG